MAQTVEATIESAEVKGPFNKGKGDFLVHEFKTDQGTFAKFAKATEKSLAAEPGDRVQILYEAGAKSNMVKAMNKVEGVVQHTARPASTSNTSSPSKSTSTFKDNTKGMIKGNSVSNGTLLAIARKGKNVTKEDILEAAKEVLQVHTELDRE